jgi:CPA1 family monovalent cation:H+ antiporter
MSHSLAEGRQELIRLHRARLIEDELMLELERDLDIEEMALFFQRGD